jgi:A/G-specific adenine glycosylase
VTTSGAEPPAVVDARLCEAIAGLRVERDFPWRRTRDPWRILVAEFCCQQTQAPRAVAAYERCCERFATPRACAEAPRHEVLAAWQGLGYYRRARALHEAAAQIVQRHGGEVPDELDALLELHGVGPYTARAVLAFAFGRDVGVLDTNAARVLARAVANRRLTTREAQHLADAVVPRGRGWAHNQAMLDLGALHCRPVPRCEGCALAACCRWRAAGFPPLDPAVGSAGTSRPQRPFAGSDREGRGRLLAATLVAPVSGADLATVAGWSDVARAERVASALVAEGLLEDRDGWLHPSGEVAADRSAAGTGR